MPKKKKDEEEKKEESPDMIEWRNLKTEAERLDGVNQKEVHDFNEFQQQREKLNYFWIVEKKKLEDKKVELRNKDRELQDLEEKHQVEIKIYKQRLKHLLYEHQNEVTQKKTEAEMALKMAQDDDREAESDIKEDRRSLNMVLKDIEFAHEEYVRGLKREQDQNITRLRHEFERKATEHQKAYEAKMKKTRDTLDKRRKDEIRAIEERKHTMIDHLMAEHSKAFADIKNYYNDITHNNLDLIKSLKEELKELEAEGKKDETKLKEKQAENRKLSAPLKRMQDEVLRLKKELEDYQVEKAKMRTVKAQLLLVEGSQSSLSWEHETLLQRLADLTKERDELQHNMRASVFDVKQKSAFRTMLLEKKLTALQRIQEEREAQLNEVLSRANLDPTVLGQVKGHVDDVLLRKNNEARKLQSEIARLQTQHEQLHLFTKKKLREYGLLVEELGYEPVSASVNPNPGSTINFRSSGPALQSEAY